MAIKFGTDGWRAVIGEDFTFENVRTVTQAICSYVKERNSANPKLVVGYDARFMSDKFARAVAEVIVTNGIKCVLSDQIVPTPAISFYVKHHNFDGGIVVTASHNPPEYNGIKFKAPYGGSATPEIMDSISGYLGERLVTETGTSEIVYEDILTPYLEHLKSFVDLSIINNSNFRVVYDAMFGAGRECFSKLLKESNIKLTEIRTEVNPSFPGINPEPIGKHLARLSDEVKLSHADIGIATDGDGDRIGCIDADGNFVNSHQIFSLLLYHLFHYKKWGGRVVRTVSTSRMIDILSKEFGLLTEETPIGFKYICESILKDDDVLIGGEESGGIAVRHHVPERDGVLMGLLLLEMMAVYNKTLKELVDDILVTRGMYSYDRIDLHIDEQTKGKLKAKLDRLPFDSIDNNRVVGTNRLDGVKIGLQDGSWLLFRPSGTEPVLRIYAEAPSDASVARLLAFGQRTVEEL